jgi:hypothetical protein
MSKSRKYNQATKQINTWEELSKCTSETHTLEIDVDGCCGWIYPKIENTRDCMGGGYYLSTHTFYGLEHVNSTRVLQSYGFNVKLANWDAKTLDF